MLNSTQPEFTLADIRKSMLLDTKEAAHVIHVKPETLRAWRSKGAPAIPFIRLGRAVRYRPEDLIAFVQANRVA